MCFSAGASFGAGAVLSIAGVASLKKAGSRSELLFAGIPLIFSVQQISEGFLWLALSDPAYAWMQQFTTYIFLFFAQVLWPVWVPLSILLIEKKEKRKKIQKFLVGTGVLVSSYLAFCLLSYNVEAKIIEYHISYELDYPAVFRKYNGILYVIVTIAPAYFSGIKRMWLFGTAILIAYIITQIFYPDYIISVWCFFAAVISISVFAIMYEIKKPDNERAVPSSLDL